MWLYFLVGELFGFFFLFICTQAVFSFITLPMSKMSEWVRKKTMPQDNYYSHPIQQHSRWSRGGQRSSSQWDREREKQRLVGQSSSTTSTATNGNSPHSHSRVCLKICLLLVAECSCCGQPVETMWLSD